MSTPVDVSLDLSAVRELISKRSVSRNLADILQHSDIMGGKAVRAKLHLTVAEMFTKRPSHLYCAAAIECLHWATLVHDDIVDGSKFRRGKPPVSEAFGLEQAILAGDFFFGEAFWFIASANSLEVTRLFSETLSTIAKAEINQFRNRNRVIMSLDDYLKTCEEKTSTLLDFTIKSAAILGGANAFCQEQLHEFAANLGVCYQLVNDVLDYYVSPHIGQLVGEDFRNGNVTAPLILTLNKADNKQEILDMFKRPRSDEDFVRIRELMLRTNALQDVKGIITQFEDRAKIPLDELARYGTVGPNNPGLLGLRAILNQVVGSLGRIEYPK